MNDWAFLFQSELGVLWCTTVISCAFKDCGSKHCKKPLKFSNVISFKAKTIDRQEYVFYHFKCDLQKCMVSKILLYKIGEEFLTFCHQSFKSTYMSV